MTTTVIHSKGSYYSNFTNRLIGAASTLVVGAGLLAVRLCLCVELLVLTGARAISLRRPDRLFRCVGASAPLNATLLIKPRRQLPTLTTSTLLCRMLRCCRLR
jgi:hypothetical protein